MVKKVIPQGRIHLDIQRVLSVRCPWPQGENATDGHFQHYLNSIRGLETGLKGRFFGRIGRNQCWEICRIE